jgi:5-formyltetrahydrofolate cyclo-ligase
VTLVSSEPVVPGRRELRERLHAARDRFVDEAGAAAHAALAERLGAVLSELAPDRLGLYWPLRSEFNAAVACLADNRLHSTAFALPYASKMPREMHYRAWDRRDPTGRDECGIPAPDGPPVVPDVVLVPCLGFTRSGYRLGYGGGYFDRWLAAHPQVTAVGLAWSACEIGEAELLPQPHDQRLILVLTERGVGG